MNRKNPGLLGVAAMMASLCAHAQFTSSVVTDSNGLMWANTVGINLSFADTPMYSNTTYWWIAGLNASNYGGYNDWALATGDGSVAPNTTTNQLGELFYTDCGNTSGSFTSLNNPGKNCGALTTVQTALDATSAGSQAIHVILSSTDRDLPPLRPGGAPLPPDFWVYDMTISTQFMANGDTSFGIGGTVGLGDALAVRHVERAPEIDPASAAGGLTLLLGAVAVLRGRRKGVAP